MDLLNCCSGQGCSDKFGGELRIDTIDLGSGYHPSYPSRRRKEGNHLLNIFGGNDIIETQSFEAASYLQTHYTSFDQPSHDSFVHQSGMTTYGGGAGMMNYSGLEFPTLNSIGNENVSASNGNGNVSSNSSGYGGYPSTIYSGSSTTTYTGAGISGINPTNGNKSTVGVTEQVLLGFQQDTASRSSTPREDGGGVDENGVPLTVRSMTRQTTAKQLKIVKNLKLPEMSLYPTPPGIKFSESDEVKKGILLQMLRDFALHLHSGVLLKQLCGPGPDVIEVHCQLLSDLTTFKLDELDGRLIEFPLKQVSNVYRVVRTANFIQGGENVEHIVVIEFLKKKLAFVFPEMINAQHFVTCMELLIRRAKGGQRPVQATPPPSMRTPLAAARDVLSSMNNSMLGHIAEAEPMKTLTKNRSAEKLPEGTEFALSEIRGETSENQVRRQHSGSHSTVLVPKSSKGSVPEGESPNRKHHQNQDNESTKSYQDGESTSSSLSDFSPDNPRPPRRFVTNANSRQPANNRRGRVGRAFSDRLPDVLEV